MKKILMAALAVISVSTASAADFFSTEKCDELFTIGVRAGVNTTNRTVSDKIYPSGYHHENWGTGFSIGAVAAINFRDYLALQPGFFFEGRAGSYTMMNAGVDIYNVEGDNVEFPWEVAQAGNRHSYNFTIPVVALVRFNVSDDVRWNVEAGPYVSFVLNSYLTDTNVLYGGDPDIVAGHMFNTKAANVDFGFKLGTGLQILGHYYVGAHYMAGCVDAWKRQRVGDMSRSLGGVTKGWVFTLGYDF